MRRPAVPRFISEISPEDKRVAVVCTVIDKGEDYLVVDDGTGVIKVFFDDRETIKRAGEYKLVRIIGRVGFMDGPVIRGEIVQNMDGLDVEAYKKLKERGWL